MTLLIILLCLFLITVVAVQIGRLTELANKIRGEEVAQLESNHWNGALSFVFMILFLAGTIISSVYYANDMLGFGPWVSASEHGGALDSMFKWTLFFTGVVFVITHIALFYFAWKYRGRKGRRAKFLPHNDNLEIIWTAIPAVVMTFLVIKGLDAWNEVMADVNPNEEYIEMEATGYQWGWMLRYPGPDGKLGKRDYTMINPGNNPLGQDWSDVKNLDDFHPNEVVLPVGKKVRVRITSRDVLHNFYLPHFRVKMDAVPGMPTYFTFTPKYTTEEYRAMLGVLKPNGEPKYPDWHEIDTEDPDGRKKFQTFDFELACAELCGRGHYSMRKIVKIVPEDEYERWMDQQQSWYMTSVRNTDADPYKGQLLNVEIEDRAEEFGAAIEEARKKESADERVVELNHINFETGSATLTANSQYQLDNLISAMEKYPEMDIAIEGHTDDTGSAETNRELSTQRAKAVYDYLMNKGVAVGRMIYQGYGASQPVDNNETQAGREKNRRVQFRITSL